MFFMGQPVSKILNWIRIDCVASREPSADVVAEKTKKVKGKIVVVLKEKTI